MTRNLAWGVALLLAWSGAASAQEWAHKMFELTEHDFGQVAKNGKAEFLFEFTNLYLEDVHVQSAVPSCSCTIVSIQNPTVKTYEKGAIVATFNTKAFRGQRGATITVTFDRPTLGTAQLHVKGYIRDDVVFNPEHVDLGDVEQGTAAERRVAVGFTSSNGWEIREVRRGNPHLGAQVREVARDAATVTYEMVVRLDERAPKGPVKDVLMLVTNDAAATQVPIQVEGRVRGAVTVSPPSIYLGNLRPGEVVEKRLVVQGKRPFRVTSISSEGKAIRVEADAAHGSKPLHVIPLRFVAGNAPGQAVQMLKVQTDLDLDGSATELPAYVVITTSDTAQK